MAPQDSNADAYKLFVSQFTRDARRIFSYILTLVGNYDDAEEIFQETSGTLWEKFSDFEQGSNFGAWACKIAYYKTLNYRTCQQKSPTLFSDSVLESLDAAIVDASEEGTSRQRALGECYEKLAPEERDLIDRRYAQGGDTQEIATNLGRSRISIYRSLAKIHDRLMHCIQRALGEVER